MDKTSIQPKVALELLQRNGSVFKCHASLQDTVFHAEVGASRVLLDAGYTIDSLMLRYQGVEWRDKANWGCNGGYAVLFLNNSVLHNQPTV